MTRKRWGKRKHGKRWTTKKTSITYKKEGFSPDTNLISNSKEFVKFEIEGVDVAVGQQFKTKDDFESILKIYMVLQKFNFNVD